MKLGILLSNIGPYHRARLLATSALGSVGVIDCSVWQGEAYSVAPVDSGYLVERLKLKEGDTFTLEQALERLNPTVLAVPGWSYWHALAALRWALKHRIPTVVFSDSMEHDRHRRFYKEFVKRRLIRLYAAALVGGRIDVDYLTKLGFRREHCFVGLDVVDNQYFACGAAQSRSQSTLIKGQLGLAKPYFLAVNRLAPSKNVIGLVRAYARYRDLSAKIENEKQIVTWNFVLVGEGALRSDLGRLVADLGLQDRVYLAGAKSYAELPIYYGHAGVFVMASTYGETWGLVVNEAMASGLPVLVSDRCGCAPELVAPSVNGFTFDPSDEQTLAQLMLKVSAANFPLAAYGAASRSSIAGWDVDLFARNIWQAAQMATAIPRLRFGKLDRWLLALLLRRRQ